MKENVLDARLERLADEVTARAATPDVGMVVRRGRRRRTRRVAGVTLAVAALVAVVAMVPAGVLELPGDLGGILDRAPADGGSPADGGRPADDGQEDGTGPDRPEGEPPIGFAGFWYGKTDASVYLRGVTDDPPGPVSDQQRAAVREQLESLGMVVEVFHETPAEAHEHAVEQWGADHPWVVQNEHEPVPDNFRVLLDQPGSFGALQEALCPPERAAEPQPCGPAIVSVVDQNDDKGTPMLGDTWPGRTDVTVFLTMDVDAAQREAIQRRLRAAPQVEQVFFESAADAALNASQELVIRAGGGTPKLPASFRVSLRSPTSEAAEAFVDAFCDSRQTGDCAPGVAMWMLHPRG